MAESCVFIFGELYLYLSQAKSPVYEGISLIRRTHEARHFHGYGYVIQVISGAVSLSGIVMHVYIALIFIYDVFAFALSQILKIVNLQSDVWHYTRILLA